MKSYVEREDLIFSTRVYQRVSIDESKYSEILVQQAQDIIEEATKIMKDFEEKLSFFKDESEVSLINKNAGKGFTRVSQDTFEILKNALYYSNLTSGLFDITIAPLVRAWAINSDNSKVLTLNEIEESLLLVDYENVILNENNLSVMLLKENQKIDLGGIAKGYIADRVIEFYKENNVKAAIVNIGGNIKVLGKKDEEKLWNIGIYEPKKHSGESICSLLVENKSIVTSGGYERAFIYNDELYHHILNPQTGCPAKTDLKSITVISEDSIKCDALSTPLFIMGKEKAYEFMKKNNISGLMVTDNDEIIVTKDLIDKFILMKEYKVLAF